MVDCLAHLADPTVRVLRKMRIRIVGSLPASLLLFTSETPSLCLCQFLDLLQLLRNNLFLLLAKLCFRNWITWLTQ